MIPVLQFDPASMALWYDTHLLSQARGHRELELALDYAMAGNDRLLQQVVLCSDDPWVATRAANIASAVWHEKRHFLDFALTNYGALRLRSLFETYVNLSAVLQMKKTSGRLLVPLDSNLDPMMRELMEIGELPADVLAIAHSVARRKAMFQDDNRPHKSPFGAVQVGGEALLEAVAYHVQLGKTHRVFGRDMVARVQTDHPGAAVVHTKYKWAYELLIRAGLLQVHVDQPGTLRFDDGPMIPICYAALAGRFFGQEQVLAEGVSSHLPGGRFMSIVLALRKRHPEIANTTAVQAWGMVNETCEAVFGRSVIDEMRIDMEHEQVFVNRVHEAAGDSHVASALADLHALRLRLFTLLQEQPEAILDQAHWADSTVSRSQPMVIAAAPGGELGAPPDGHERLSGYDHGASGAPEVPDGRWWWASTSRDWPPSDQDDLLCLRAKDSWRYIASEYAPLGKLLYAGNNMRVMLGPELFAARIRFEHTTGFKLVMDPAFAWPKQVHDIAFWYYITGRDRFRCDLSGETVQAPEGFMLDAWELRLRPALVQVLLGGVADQERMRLTLWRDWTPWLLSEEFREFFDSFKVDEAALNRALA